MHQYNTRMPSNMNTPIKHQDAFEYKYVNSTPSRLLKKYMNALIEHQDAFEYEYVNRTPERL